MSLAGFMLALTAAGSVTSGPAQESDQWAPVNIPLAHVRALIPCTETDIAAFSKSHPVPAGIVACEKPGYLAHVMYLVNTGPGFFDHFSAMDQKKAKEHLIEEYDRHRFYRSHNVNDDKDEVTQLVELNSTSSLMMLLRSKVAPNQQFVDMSHRFFNSVEFTDQ